MSDQIITDDPLGNDPYPTPEEEREQMMEAIGELYREVNGTILVSSLWTDGQTADLIKRATAKLQEERAKPKRRKLKYKVTGPDSVEHSEERDMRVERFTPHRFMVVKVHGHRSRETLESLARHLTDSMPEGISDVVMLGGAGRFEIELEVWEEG